MRVVKVKHNVGRYRDDRQKTSTASRIGGGQVGSERGQSYTYGGSERQAAYSSSSRFVISSVI